MMLLATPGGGFASGAGNGMSVIAQSLNGMGSGFLSGGNGSQSFSFTDGPLGFNLNSLGQQFSIRPDFITKLALGNSWSIFSRGQNLGWIGFDPATSSYVFNGEGGSGFGSSLAASLASSGAF
jgi:hypothetical protein